MPVDKVFKGGPRVGGVPKGLDKGKKGGPKQFGPTRPDSGSIHRGEKIQGGAKKSARPNPYGGAPTMGNQSQPGK